MPLFDFIIARAMFKASAMMLAIYCSFQMLAINNAPSIYIELKKNAKFFDLSDANIYFIVFGFLVTAFFVLDYYYATRRDIEYEQKLQKLKQLRAKNSIVLKHKSSLSGY